VVGARYAARREVRRALLEPGAFAFDPAAARARLDLGASSQRLLVCEENLSGYPHNGGLGGLLPKTVAERIKAVMPNAQIVVFLREQAAAIAAAYAQYVRSGGTRSLAAYLGAQHRTEGALSHWYKAPFFDLAHFDYQGLLDHFASLFGRSAVHVFLNEVLSRDPRDFAARFAERLNLEVDLEALDFSPRNRSLSPAGIALMRWLNLFTPQSVVDKTCLAPIPGWYRRRWWIARAVLGARIESIATPEQRLGQSAANEIRERFSRSNLRLAHEWALPLEDFGYLGAPLVRERKSVS
jgi:hypothetical protein